MQEHHLGENSERNGSDDELLSRVFRHVEPPCDLAERILARLTPLAEATSVREGTIPSIQAAFDSRRIVWTAAAVISLAAALMLFVLQVCNVNSGRLSAQAVLTEALHQVMTMGETVQGLPIAEVAPPEQFALPSRIRLPGSVRWFWMSKPLAGRPAIGYRCLLGQLGTAYLIVVPNVSGRLPAQLPADPMLSTGGYCAGLWAENGRLFVLVVKGSRHSYRRLTQSWMVPVA